jgi:hypothetical protein
MPRSRTRHKHHHQQHHSNPPQQQAQAKTSTRRSAVSIMIVFIGLLGLFIAFIAAGTDILWLIVGALAGAVAGYFIGRSMDRLAAKK